MSDLLDLQRCHFDECRVARWDPDRKNSFAEEIAHLHEEVSEAFKAWRIFRDFAIHYEPGTMKPIGVPIELADVLIGIFYNAELHGIDLEAALRIKGAFNRRRDYVAEGRQLHHEPARTPLR
jgi:NTP pyrophosphatase (non-canonical NTP hydrolase)